MGANFRPLTLAAIAMLAALLLGGCKGRVAGVSFTDSFEGTELFKTISLAGERTAGSKLTVNVGITDGYPVPVRVACYYEDPDSVTEDQENLTFQERAKLIGETVLAPREGRRPDEGKGKATDLPRETLSFDFSVPEPGRYSLACLTPAASDNGLGLDFTIAP